MAEIGIAVAGKAAELSVVPIGKHICYPFKCQSNIDCLKKQVEKLEDLRNRVQHDVDEAKRQGDGIENDVSKWLNSVDEFIQGVKKTIIEDEDNAKKRCFIGLCPNLMTRYSLSKKAENKTKDGVVLFGGGKFEKVSYRQPLQKIPSTYSRGYDDFDSRKENFSDLMEALRNSDVNLIGVYGMGGVGKTTLVKKVAAQALEEQLFDVVVMVEVTETTPDVKNIQGQIADKLGLKFHEETLQGRAGRLCDRLKKEKKVLLVLDNIWKKLDLEAVGIPSREEEEKRSSLQVDRKVRNDEQRQSLQADPKGKNDELWQCKVLLTSRKLHVLRDMNIRKNVPVQILSPEESKVFFWNIVVDSKKKFDFDDFAVEIVKYCAGLPVAIATIANALKNRSSYDDWKRALDQLSQYCGRHIIGMDANVYSPIKLSYDFLEIAEAKSLFLLCSLFNASCSISIVDLLKYGTGLRLFQDVSTLEQRRNKLHMLINNLKDSCLLLEGDTNDDVKMHDIIHEVAVSIASTDELMFNVQDVTDLEETLEEKLHKDSTAISLPYKDVSVLPQRLEYSKLRLLFLFMDEFSLQIPNSLFEGIKTLEVLNLTKIHMLSLPPSLGWLTNLQTLCLDQCQLRNIAIIGELKRLEILCFRGSDIEHLPKQIGQLTRLKLLELSNCSTLEVISPNVISSLTRLEELYMGNSFSQWDVEGQSNASLSELKELCRLTTLEIHVLDAQVMPEDLLIFEKLERFRIIIGDAWEWSDDFESSRRLKLKLIDSIVLGKGVKMLLNRTEDLYLDELKGVKNVLYELNVEEFPQLKHLQVQNGHEIQCIVHSIQRGLCNVFPKLESLFLHNLINLEKLFHGQLTTKSLAKLRILKIGKCDRLEHLFSFSMAKNLLQLEEIEVTECKKLKEIVFNKKDEQIHQSGRVNGTEFTRLRTLRLQRLPQLTSFGFNKFTPNTGHQEILVEDELGSCLSSFGQNVLLPSLENLKLSSIKIECLWLDQLPAMSSCCQTLTSLTLEECSGNLKFLFSYSMVKSLVLLEKLEIKNCTSIEGVINSEELRGEGKVIKMVFPKLINLQLEDLPNLTQFASGNTVEFPSLTQLSIKNCQKLKTFSGKEIEEINCQDDIHPFFDEKVELPTLAALTLISIASQTICHNQLQAHSACFHNLTTLTVYACDNLKHLFPFSVAESLNNLEVLTILICNLMEGVITTQGERKSSTLFPKLKRLYLNYLPELTRFCNFNGNSIELPSLSELIIEDCPKMQTFASNSLPGIEEPEEVNTDTEENLPSFFDEKVELPTLASLKLSYIASQTIWHNQLQPHSACFHNLKELTVYRCDNLKHLFPLPVAESLNNLEVLTIWNCKLMEGVITTQGERKSSTLFPKLKRLYLNYLPELTRFCNFNGNSIELPSLSELIINDCPQMQTFASNSLPGIEEPEEVNTDTEENLPSFFDEKVMLPTLASINLSSIGIQTIWHNQLQPMSPYFQNLKEIVMHGCDTVKYGLPSSMVESLVQLEVLEISNCKLMEVVTITAGERIINTLFTKLHRLHLKHLPELTTFCNFAGKLIELTSLAELRVENCPKMHAFVSNSPRADMPAAKEEQINSEKNLHSHIQPFFDEKVELPTLTYLLLNNIASQTIWHNQLQSHSACFHNLTDLAVYSCGNLKHLFPFSVSENLNHLEDLHIWNCKLMEGVITTQGERKSSTLFPKLMRLKLHYLPELTRFCNFNGNSIELPSLSELIINDCPKMQTFASNSLPGIEEPEEVNTDTEENLPSLFDEKVSFSCLKKLWLSQLPELLHLWKKNSQPSKVFENLESLKVSGCSNLKTLVPSSVSLQNLETLEVQNCDGLISLVTFSTAKSLEQLKRMEIIDCKLIEEIIIDMGDEIKDVIVFNQLEYLKLRNLPSLTSFCKGSFTIEFPYLQRVLVIECLKMMNFSQGVLSTPKLQSLQMTESFSEEDEGCWEGDLNTTVQKVFRDMDGFRYTENFTVSDFPHLKELWHEKLLASYFSNLKSLVVDDKYCSLRYIFTPSVALGLVQLRRLEIKNCAILEVITVTGEETISNTMFPNLNSLKLINLPNLTCFCNFAENSIELPSLTQLSIENCPNMETFISNFLGVDMSTSKDNCHTDIQPLFDEKVGLPDLKFLRLDKMDKLKKIWHHQLSSESFCKLNSFGVTNCHNVLNVIPSNLFGRLQKLEVLWLTNCSSLYEIFELQASGCGKTQAITATQLEKLVLDDLPKLKHIWDVDSQGLLTCQNLISIQVTGCGSLKSIFPASVGRNLLQLDKLWIDNCCMVEEIFAKEEQVDEAVPRFPRLTLLRLGELPRLRSFYPRVHISEWPMLKKLQIWICDKVEVSASNFLSFQVTHEMPLDQPLLLFDKVPLTNLESLGLDWKWFEKEALHEKLPEYSCKLNFLTIQGFHKGADICVFCFLHKLPNLEKLQVGGGSFKGLFLCEGFGCEEKHVEAPSKLSHLRLAGLNDSLHLWEENSLSSKGFQNLAILEVVWCSNLKSLVPSSVSFQNLTRLKVFKCNELLNLVAVPTAKSLVQLTELSISECKMVEEIIIHEGDEVKERIIFKKLRNLKLKCLPCLTSFYPGSYTIVFPSLQQVVVSECPNMKIFSRGVLSTPMLHRLQTTEEEGKGFWKGNLNTTVEHLFIESSKEN